MRSILGLGLKEAKEMVEKVPVKIKENIKKVEADELKVKLEKIGCKINIIWLLNFFNLHLCN